MGICDVGRFVANAHEELQRCSWAFAMSAALSQMPTKNLKCGRGHLRCRPFCRTCPRRNRNFPNRNGDSCVGICDFGRFSQMPAKKLRCFRGHLRNSCARKCPRRNFTRLGLEFQRFGFRCPAPALLSVGLPPALHLYGFWRGRITSLL